MEKIIIKYLTDTISDEEMMLLKDWLHDQEHQKLFESHVKNHLEVNLLLQEPDVSRAYEKVWHRIQSKRRPIRRLFPKRFRYAAIFIGFLIGVFVVYRYTSQEGKSSLRTNKITLQLEDGTLKVLNENASGIITHTDGTQVSRQQRSILLYSDSIHGNAATDALTYNELSVPYGKKFQLKLSDGTHVFLNSGSKLKYPVRFSEIGNREVYLDGEAYFSVEKSEDRPFVVNTDEMNTVVLGTQFNVSSYKNENNTSTVLVEGLVRVEDKNKNRTFHISPGQRAVFEGDTITVDKVNIEKHIAWTKNQLYFVNDRFELIIKELERHFDVKIQSHYENLNKKPFTGTFETETLEEILTAFQLHSSFTYEKIESDGIIVIEKNSE